MALSKEEMERIGSMFKREDVKVEDGIDMDEYVNGFVDKMNENLGKEETEVVDKNFDLLESCNDYLENPSEENLNKFVDCLNRCSTMSAPVVYRHINKYKDNPKYKNQCITMQQIILSNINENNLNAKSM